METLSVADVPELSDLLATATEEDRRFFTPFAFSPQAIDAVLRPMVKDLVVGVRIQPPGNPPELAGFYMLRGLDEGYASPMYGVFVQPSRRRLGIANVTLMHAIAFGKLNRLPSLLLKVYPNNKIAINAYSAVGFEVIRTDGSQLIMQLNLTQDSHRAAVSPRCGLKRA